jgi:hypothetical protein
MKISQVDADYLYKNDLLKKEDLRMELPYNLEEKGITSGMKINLNQMEIGGQILNNIDVLVDKDLQIPLVVGRKIGTKVGTISIDNNNFAFGIVKEPYSPIKIDLTNEEFAAAQRQKVIDNGNLKMQANLISNLRRYVRGNEKYEDKELRITLAFKLDLDSKKENDKAYSEELELNQKTVGGKMMYETFKMIHNNEMTKQILEYYGTTSFNLSFMYADKTNRVRYTITRDKFKELPADFTKEDFLKSLSAIIKK